MTRDIPPLRVWAIVLLMLVVAIGALGLLSFFFADPFAWLTDGLQLFNCPIRTA